MRPQKCDDDERRRSLRPRLRPNWPPTDAAPACIVLTTLAAALSAAAATAEARTDAGRTEGTAAAMTLRSALSACWVFFEVKDVAILSMDWPEKVTRWGGRRGAYVCGPQGASLNADTGAVCVCVRVCALA